MTDNFPFTENAIQNFPTDFVHPNESMRTLLTVALQYSMTIARDDLFDRFSSIQSTVCLPKCFMIFFCIIGFCGFAFQLFFRNIS